MFRSSGLVETKNGYKGVVLVAEKKEKKWGYTQFEPKRRALLTRAHTYGGRERD